MRLSPTRLHFRPREGSWTVGGRGGPGLTQGRRTENHDVPRRTSRVAVRVGNPSHSYHPEGFHTGARSPGGGVGWGGVGWGGVGWGYILMGLRHIPSVGEKKAAVQAAQGVGFVCFDAFASTLTRPQGHMHVFSFVSWIDLVSRCKAAGAMSKRHSIFSFLF